MNIDTLFLILDSAPAEIPEYMMIFLFFLPFMLIGLGLVRSGYSTVFTFFAGTVAIFNAFIFTDPEWLTWIFIGLGMLFCLTAVYQEGRGKR